MSHWIPLTLNQRTDYNGSEKLYVGNGQGLDISKIGSSIFRSLNGAVCLKNILHVPQIIKILLSIAKITSDNNVIVEFNFNCVFVKD